MTQYEKYEKTMLCLKMDSIIELPLSLEWGMHYLSMKLYKSTCRYQVPKHKWLYWLKPVLWIVVKNLWELDAASAKQGCVTLVSLTHQWWTATFSTNYSFEVVVFKKKTSRKCNVAIRRWYLTINKNWLIVSCSVNNLLIAVYGMTWS